MSDRRVRWAIVAALTVVVLDQATKAIVEHTMRLYQTIPLLPFFSLTYVRNTGAAFGILSELSPTLRLPLFVGMAVVVVGVLVAHLRQVRAEELGVTVALGGIVGGAAGNLICRLRYGEVVDFLHLHYRGYSWPMFNVADSAITVGALVVLVSSLRAAPQPAPNEGR